MSNKAITISDLGKLYKIGGSKSGSLRETIAGQVKEVKKKSKYQDFWALKDVSFDVNQGEVLGVVGKNGAGKSTLLKLISRITHPTTGRIDINGRVASLLEVGTGFHPELTGRENIFLNGTLLGMTKAEIRLKFDEIVAFSGVEKFIDTPVKRYSSGMYVRLAFSVAAHLEPEILIIDEVLAVGDVGFQKKCLGKMKNVAGEGRTVMFVSHNMQAVTSLCTRAIYLDDGMKKMDGRVDQVIDLYQKGLLEYDFNEKADINNSKNRRGRGDCRFKSIRLLNGQDEETQIFEYGKGLKAQFEIVINNDLDELFVGMTLKSGLNLEMVTSVRHEVACEKLSSGQSVKFELLIDNLNLRPGTYETYFNLTERYPSDSYDTVDGLLAPITVSATGDLNELGFDASSFNGYFSLDSQITL